MTSENPAATSGTATAAGSSLPAITVDHSPDGTVLRVDGRPLMVYGMNWGYMPIGQNYSYSLWNQPEDVIRAALDREMPLLRAMGVNVIRQYAGIPPRWVQYIYEKYGIWTVLNDFIGRYGMTIEGVWHPVTDYSDPKVRSILKQGMHDLVGEFKDTPGVLMWLLGNENNYGLSWSSFEIENLPEGERNAARARYLYSLFGEIIADVKSVDPTRPVAIANGDVQYIDLIAEECKGLDVFGTNVYRGISARDLFQVVHDKLGTPVMFTEFGCDAFNAATMKEDQAMQARYLLGQWEEIYEQSAGKGRVGNAIGGFIFQWSDGWWKYKQEERLDIHDTHASWANGGYPEDLLPGENNMNEEWWGITEITPRSYVKTPRQAYETLKELWTTAESDFGISVSPSGTVVEAGTSTQATISVSERGTYTNTVELEVSSPSTGITVSLSIQEGTPSFDSVMTINVGSAVASGDYEIIITGRGAESAGGEHMFPDRLHRLGWMGCVGHRNR